MTEYCGTVSIIGRPNVGKSTLLNHFIGQKLSITSRKPQTTRHQFVGIKTSGVYQMIFVDTPGIHSNAKNAMNHYMNQAAKNALVGVDVILFVVDALKWTDEDLAIAGLLEKQSVPIIFVVNKVDRVNNKDDLLPFLKTHSARVDFAAVCPVSALKGTGVDNLEQVVQKLLPVAEHVYGEDDMTDRSARFIVAERIREKLMRRMGEELPYALTVSVDAFEEDNAMYKIAATIWVNKQNQKGMVIGKKGAMLKSIGSDARVELEEIFGLKVFLKLWVKVREGWADDMRALQSLGYGEQD